MNEPIPVKNMKKILEDNLKILLADSFGIIEDAVMSNGIRISKDNKDSIAKLKTKVSSMEKEVEEYSKECHNYFSQEILEIMEGDLDSFKDSIFGEKLWTVRSSLHDMSNPELDRYRDSFDNATPREIYTCVKTILDKTVSYVKEIFPKIDMRRILKIENMKLEYLDGEDVLLTGVIGLGIRSELLHRMYPRVFPIMTRRSLWGMFFLTNQNEFVVDENRDGRSRTSHEWNYEYPRFCFYMNYLTLLLEYYFDKYGIKLKNEIRYGYINLMLVEYAKKHKNEIDKLYKWEPTGLN